MKVWKTDTYTVEMISQSYHAYKEIWDAAIGLNNIAVIIVRSGVLRWLPRHERSYKKHLFLAFQPGVLSLSRVLDLNLLAIVQRVEVHMLHTTPTSSYTMQLP